MQGKIILKKGVVPHLNLIGNSEHSVKEYSQLSSSAEKRKRENIQLVSQKAVKRLRFEEPSTSAQISSPETSPNKYKVQQSSSSSSLFSAASKTSTSLEENSDSSDESFDVTLHLRKLSAERTLSIVEKHSRFYLGLPEDTYFMIKILEFEAKVIYRNILIVLKKIRLNDAFYRLALDFGISVSTVAKIFGKDLITLAAHFKNLIYWPQPDFIKFNLPIGFRVRYNNVQSIIDCFEIQIEQPTNSLHQSLTWSEYKKANTLKYLISSTPDGIINFVSEGYGGRVTDTEIVKDCGYLDILPKDSGVMADRGFKRIDSELAVRNCTLIRPPSVATGTKSTKEDIKLSKRIASLRIHIERVIRRLREFEMLQPHACIDLKMAWKLDYVVYIACGIINFQGPLIK